MTLFKQIMIAIIAFGFVIFTVVGYLNFKSLNNYINDQLGVNARHTANSLGLSIKPVLDPEDMSMAETMINSMFDSGYYSLIKLDDIDGKSLIENSGRAFSDEIPKWFIDSVNLKAPVESSEIMTGWAKFGTLYVQSSVEKAYFELYQGLKEIFYTISTLFLIMIVTTYFGLKAIFKPLNNVQKQAEAILDNTFIIQDRIPFTTDLKQMVLAMNSMVSKVKDIFEREAATLHKYEELLYKDGMSGLYNRRYFQNRFDEYVGSEEYSSGTVALVSFKDLMGLKKSLGFEKWQSLIIKISQILQENLDLSKHFGFVARLNDSDFIILLSGVSSENLKDLSNNIMVDLQNTFVAFNISDSECVANMAIVDYAPQSELKTILTTADVTLADARTIGSFKYKIFSNSNKGIVLGKEKYRDLIMKSMQNDMFKFAAQKVISDDVNLEHSEIYLRLVDENGKWQMASYFMPMVNELELSPTLDMHVIQRVGNMMSDGRIDGSLAINLGKEVISSDDNFIKLTNLLKKIGANLKNKVYIEIPNKDDISTGSMIKLINALKQHGFGFGIDHFEFNSSSIERLKEISPQYVKIRAANIMDFFGEKDTDEAKKTIEVIMGSRGIRIIGIGVENEEQKSKLLELGITSMQGIYIDETKNIG